MSAYDEYKKTVNKMADKLPAPKKEVDQSILWLKASVIEKLQRYNDSGLYVGKAGEDSFGFKESTVNQLLQYAYEAGMKRSDENNKQKIASMKNAIDSVIESVGEYIDYPEY